MKNAPQELPFQAENNEAKNYLKGAVGLHEFFGYTIAKKEFKREEKHLNYLIPDELCFKIDGDSHFRNSNFSTFLNCYIKPKTGTILCRDGGQYCFILLGKHETKELKKTEGRYIAAALFMENIFLGFEEGVITEKGLQVWHTGYYSNAMDIGGFLSFVMVFLAYLNSKDNLSLVGKDINNTSEIIYLVD
ncbi:hypothetical protein [Puia dinghuensis]|nr:hypothetical protein [Puia dinghuensis]